LNAPPFFLDIADDPSRFAEKLHVLLSWSVTPLQYGDHRSFAAATLIRNWRDRACDRATRRHLKPPDGFLQDQLFDWLDSSKIASEPDCIRAVALLFGSLLKYELFSYASYIQRLVARGEQGLSFIEVRSNQLIVDLYSSESLCRKQDHGIETFLGGFPSVIPLL
jgi:mediator of RNA polymerase II transcription subunit 12, fungi type